MNAAVEHRQSTIRRTHWLLQVALVLAVIAASRISRLPTLELDDDEVWSIWMTFGTPAQIIAWTPYDWPPGFYLMVGAWRGLVGIHPVAISLGTAFAYLLGLACLYRALRRLFGPRGDTAALIGIIAVSALGQSIMLSMMIRGYGYLMALSMLMLWFTLRYFDHPTLLRGILLGLVMALMFWIHMTAIIGYAMIGLLTLFRYRQKLWRWRLPGAMAAILAAPEIISKYQLVGVRASQINPLFAKPALDLLGGIYGEILGLLIPVWVILAAVSIGAVVMALMRRSNSIRGYWLPVLTLWIGFPLILLIFHQQLGFMFSARHTNWVLIGIGTLVGLGLALLPRSLAVFQLLGVGVLVVALFWEIPPRPSIPATAFTNNFAWLAERMKPGDVVLVDPNAYSSTPYQWDLFARIYFPQGVAFVREPGSAATQPRVWYVSMDGQQDAATYAAVKRDRVAGPFVGRWNFLIRLWEGPPDATGTMFANGMRFLGSELSDALNPAAAVWRRGEDVRLRLWWRANNAIGLDYSTSIVVMNDLDNQIVARLDGPPNVTDAPKETSQWQVGRYYVDERLIDMPSTAGHGMYTIYLIVYQWWDNTRIDAPGLTADRMLPIQHFMVKSW